MSMISVQKIDKNSVLLLKAFDEELHQDPYEKGLQESGLNVVHLPVLEFSFINADKLLQCLERPDDFSALVFTSQRAVEAVQRCCPDSSVMMGWTFKPVFAVGKSTSYEAERLGLEVLGRDTGNADSLLHIVTQHLCDTDKPVLFPCGNLRRESLPVGLRKAGIKVHELIVYETGPRDTINEDMVQLALGKGVPEFVCFFSPSGVKFTKDALHQTGLLSRLKLISMGPSTSHALREAAMTVCAEAAEPSAQGVIDAVRSIHKHNT